jgi:hypothetical protein
MTIDGMSSVQTGLEIDGVIDLRKRAVASSSGMETPDALASNSYYSSSSNNNIGGTKELYQVIQEKQVVGGTTGQLFGSDRTYVIPGSSGAGAGSSSEIVGSVSGSSNISSSSGIEEDEVELGEKDKKKKRMMDATSNIAKKYKDFKF